MATGLLVRDFTKVYRELRYENEGSIRLSEIEHNAYLNRLTLEVTHVDAYRSVNFKTNPDNTHWGFLTSFKGTAVTQNLPVKFAKQRVFEHINQGIWNYHESTENIRLTKSFGESVASSILQSDLLEEAQQTVVDFYLNLIGNLPNQIEEDLQWILSFTYRGEPPATPGNQAYTGFPVCSPFPDLFKFKSDIPVSFLFRLESWYLVNPAVYITSNPTDTSDETEGEDEYPEPENGSGDGSGAGFPTPNQPPADSDPRDFGDSEFGTIGTWSVVLRYSDPGGNADCNDVPLRTETLPGYSNTPPIFDVREPEGTNPRNRIFIQTPLASIFVARDCAIGFESEPVFIPPA